MPEKVNEVLGVAEAAPVQETKQKAPTTAHSETTPNNGAENTLNTIAYIVLGFGILASLICLFTIIWIRDPQYQYIERTIFNPTGFVTTIMVLFFSIISWSLMRVLANISLTLKDINKKIK